MSDKKLVVDISKWNYPVDFSKLKKAGVNGVIIRAGSGNKKDERFKEYTQEAIAMGFDIGFYWFVYIHSGKTITENAVQFDAVIRPYKDYITLKVWCDYEYDTDEKLRKYDGITLNKNDQTRLVLDFCDTMKFYGYECGVYANRDYYTTKFDAKKISGLPLWYARYTSTEDATAKDAYLWQFSSKYNIGGKLYDCNYLKPKMFPAITVTQAFNACGIPSNYAKRVRIALENGMDGYSGKAEENAELVKRLADGKLKSPF